ncbi:MAG: PTS sugar transporter subunit IIA [Deltaproteobacteria bacterium]|nr:PTS sugar transporter subunit IIA [Deltaproteobacteria bacterium]
MIGAVVVTHGNIGTEMIRAAESIVKEKLPFLGVALEHHESVPTMKSKIREAIASCHSPQGVLLLSDLFGGTPCNLCLSFLKEVKVEVVTGVNLPMLIKLAHYRENRPLKEVARFIREYGKKNITLARQVLKGDPPRGESPKGQGSGLSRSG